MCRQLAPLRRISEEFIKAEHFVDAQDKAFIQDVLNACRDKWFWKFVAVTGDTVFGCLEEFRRWGMICGCEICNNRRRELRVKHTFCPRNGRRLAEAWTHTKEVVAELRETALDMTPALCEGSQSLCEVVQAMLRTAADQLTRRLKFTGLVPWLFATADSPEGARECLKQMNAVPLPDHDPVTRDISIRLLPDLEQRAAGGELTPALRDEVHALQNCSLDESCGEGYHRDTTREKQRAAGASLTHLKRHTRVKGVIRMLKSFHRQHGVAGRRVIGYEMEHYKRILQHDPKRRWRGRQMRTSAFMKRLYREDEMGDVDWTSIAQRLPVDRPVPTTEANTRAQLEKEYLAAVLEPLKYYSVEHTVSRTNDDGVAVPVQEHTRFQVLGAQHGTSRLKTMHTVQSKDDITKSGSLALHIVRFDRWQDPDAPDDPRLIVYPDGADEWVCPTTLADFDSFQNRLTYYRSATNAADHPRCIVLADPKEAQPRYALTDARYPTLALAWYLRHHGWDPAPRHCEHNALLPEGARGEFDSREAVRMKFYYMVLTQLQRCLPLSGYRVPSQQPIAFYRLLLNGAETMPDLGNKHYVLEYNRRLKPGPARKHQLEPLPPPEPKPIEAGDFFVVPVGAPEPKRRASSGVGPRGRGGGRGRGSGRGEGGPPEPEPAPLPLPPPPPAPVPAPVPPVVVGPPEESEEAYFAVPVPPAPVDREREHADFKDGLDGCRVRWQAYVTPMGVPQPNFMVKCPHHNACYKTCGTIPRHQKQFGDIEPLAILHAWAKLPWAPEAGGTHRGLNPTKQQVRAYAVERLVDLQNLYASFDI